MITIYVLTYNSEIHIQFMIDWYRSRFSNCHIIAYDNMSTDNTIQIAQNNNCNIISYDTNNQIQDRKYLEIKNNCWKSAATDWVLICDIDEMLDINEDQLKNESNCGSTIITTEGYNMVNMVDNNCDISSIKYGARAIPYDKSYLFNKSMISNINYEAGCHRCSPQGTIKYSDAAYKAYHYNFINIDIAINKCKAYAKRLSSDNLKYGWGNQYLQAEEKLRTEFNDIRSKAIKLL